MDGAGNAISQAGVAITATFPPSRTEFPGASRRFGNAGPQLGGLLRATSNASGMIAFSDISVTYAGIGYVIQVEGDSQAIPIIRSLGFSVDVGARERASIVRESAGLVASLPFRTQPIVAVSDAGGNWIAGSVEVVLAEFKLDCDPTENNCQRFGTTEVGLATLGSICVLNGVEPFEICRTELSFISLN